MHDALAGVLVFTTNKIYLLFIEPFFFRSISMFMVTLLRYDRFVMEFGTNLTKLTFLVKCVTPRHEIYNVQ